VERNICSQGLFVTLEFMESITLTALSSTVIAVKLDANWTTDP